MSNKLSKSCQKVVKVVIKLAQIGQKNVKKLSKKQTRCYSAT
jgi:hypothetical protein